MMWNIASRPMDEESVDTRPKQAWHAFSRPPRVGATRRRGHLHCSLCRPAPRMVRSAASSTPHGSARPRGQLGVAGFPRPTAQEAVLGHRDQADTQGGVRIRLRRCNIGSRGTNIKFAICVVCCLLSEYAPALTSSGLRCEPEKGSPAHVHEHRNIGTINIRPRRLSEVACTQGRGDRQPPDHPAHE